MRRRDGASDREQRSVHPVLALGLGETAEVAARLPVAGGPEADGSTLRELKHGTRFQVRAVWFKATTRTDRGGPQAPNC
jgi:hypothetical protein